MFRALAAATIASANGCSQPAPRPQPGGPDRPRPHSQPTKLKQRRFSFSQSSGLVDEQWYQPFQAARVPLHHGSRRPAVHPDNSNHDGQRCRETQSTRPSNDKDRNGSTSPNVIRGRTPDRPCGKCNERNRNDKRDKPARNLICKPLVWAPGCAARWQPSEQSRQHRIAADLFGRHQKPAAGIDRAGNDFRSASLLTGMTRCYHRFIQR